VVKVIRSTVLNHPIDRVWDVLRDFNGHDRWHPEVETSSIERGWDADRVGCIRKFKLSDGSELREQLLKLSDLETAYSYCLYDTPIPLLNYVSEVRLIPVTDEDATFWEWQGRFDTPKDRREELTEMVGTEIYEAGFDAIRAHLDGEAA